MSGNMPPRPKARSTIASCVGDRANLGPGKAESVKLYVGKVRAVSERLLRLLLLDPIARLSKGGHPDTDRGAVRSSRRSRRRTESARQSPAQTSLRRCGQAASCPRAEISDANAGRRRVNVVTTPGVLDRNTPPPWRSAIDFTIASPSPEPSEDRVRAPSVR